MYKFFREDNFLDIINEFGMDFVKQVPCQHLCFL